MAACDVGESLAKLHDAMRTMMPGEKEEEEVWREMEEVLFRLRPSRVAFVAAQLEGRFKELGEQSSASKGPVTLGSVLKELERVAEADSLVLEAPMRDDDPCAAFIYGSSGRDLSNSSDIAAVSSAAAAAVTSETFQEVLRRSSGLDALRMVLGEDEAKDDSNCSGGVLESFQRASKALDGLTVTAVPGSVSLHIAGDAEQVREFAGAAGECPLVAHLCVSVANRAIWRKMSEREDHDSTAKFPLARDALSLFVAPKLEDPRRALTRGRRRAHHASEDSPVGFALITAGGMVPSARQRTAIAASGALRHARDNAWGTKGSFVLWSLGHVGNDEGFDLGDALLRDQKRGPDGNLLAIESRDSVVGKRKTVALQWVKNAAKMLATDTSDIIKLDDATDCHSRKWPLMWSNDKDLSVFVLVWWSNEVEREFVDAVRGAVRWLEGAGATDPQAEVAFIGENLHSLEKSTSRDVRVGR